MGIDPAANGRPASPTRNRGTIMTAVLEERVRVLVAEMDRGILAAAADELHTAGYDVTNVRGGAEVIAAGSQGVELVVLELSLADMDGVDVIRRLRTASSVPIIVCTARTERVDRLAALHAGADDLLTRPFAAVELLARMRAVRRRCLFSGRRVRPLVLGTYEVNLSTRSVCGDGGRRVPLTATQWALLELLARRPGQTVRHVQILEQVWGPGYGSETQYLRQYMAQLRRRLEVDPQRPRHLLTEPGVGYRLEL